MYGVMSEVTYRLPSTPRAVVNGLTPRFWVGKRPGASSSELVIVCVPGLYVIRKQPWLNTAQSQV